MPTILTSKTGLQKSPRYTIFILYFMDDENQSQENKNYGFSETHEKKMLIFTFL